VPGRIRPFKLVESTVRPWLSWKLSSRGVKPDQLARLHARSRISTTARALTASSFGQRLIPSGSGSSNYGTGPEIKIGSVPSLSLP
jgi:hypothetical protein